ncbi:3'-5' exonuclease [Butyrivibrio sp. AE2032]|uniref:3'-5' exonuclease n=1 Tax=Butyrivibrio sp. AE2032 TaxID=1458463 RepID=UPI00054E9D44|nr:exonuclease domain-containing protein [Butyrivibrio sp. AE2032]
MLLLEYCHYYVLFDLETTGLSSEKDAIIEISALKVSDGKVIDEFSTLVNPVIHIPYMASSINGITDDMVQNAPDIEQALTDFISFIGNNVLVGHNLRNFDLKFIQRDCMDLFGKTLPNDYVDTLILSRRYLPDLSSHSLEALAYHYGISYEGAHRALADCHITKQVYDNLAKEIENPSEAAKNVKVCPRCGNILKKRNGKFGEFWGCASYPECKYTRDIDVSEQ